MTDGREIYARTASGAFFNLLKSPRQPLLVVDGEGMLRQLTGRARSRARARRKT
jgi:hypothetical protein